MTKAQLIEQLAESDYNDDCAGWRDDMTYAGCPDGLKAEYRERVTRYLPLIVAFVAEWLTEPSEDPETNAQMDELAKAWRQEMS